MKKAWPFFLVFLLAFTTLHAQFQPGKIFVKIQSDDNREFPQFRRGQTRPSYDAFPGVAAMLDRFRVSELYKPFKTKNIHVQHIYELHFDPAVDVLAMIGDWEQLPYVEYAEQLPIYEMSYTPNDYSPLQWGLFRIDAGTAWDICKGDRKVTVAIVDDAVRMTHEDLAPQLWTNPGEIPGDGIDNEGNGWIDDVNGYDLADVDNDPNPPAGADDNAFSHGTHTAGIACAATDNGTGVASVGFNVTLVPVKTKEDTTINDPYLYATFTGVDYAVANRFDIVSMSFGSTNYNASMAYLVQAGHDSGMVMIAAAGNTGSYAVHYPSAYDGVISVGSTEYDDRKSGFSTWHYSIDLMAPGGGIYSTVAGGDDNYGIKSGTSMSCPLVSSLAALMLAADSTLSPDDVLNCLQGSADNIDAMNQAYVGNIGAGRINAGRALYCVVPTAVQPGRHDGFHLDRIFPNPVETRALFAANLPHDGLLQIKVVDIQGRQVGPPMRIEGHAGLTQAWWSRPEGTAAGLYLVTWEWEGQVGSQKMILR
ncbi:MAG TPA: S8 family peptidase [Bacteroidia bacterium]|nr:S8 family peptidase [Bacteroidia bacterium]